MNTKPISNIITEKFSNWIQEGEEMKESIMDDKELHYYRLNRIKFMSDEDIAYEKYQQHIKHQMILKLQKHNRPKNVDNVVVIYNHLGKIKGYNKKRGISLQQFMKKFNKLK